MGVEYVVEWVPFEERGPIAAFQLEAVREAGVVVPAGVPVLPILDSADCLALIANHASEDGSSDGLRRLDGLVYVRAVSPVEGAMLLYWVREGTPSHATHLINVALDDWLEKNGLRSLRGGVRRCPHGFRKTGVQVVERVLELDP